MKRPIISILAVSVLLFGIAGAGTQGEGMVKYSEDFENDGDFIHWATNGKYDVNFAGRTTERSYSGKYSYKIDITWKDGSWNYWIWNVKMQIPCYGNPVLRGKLYVKGGEAAVRARLGFAFADPESGLFGGVNMGRSFPTEKEGWREFRAPASGSYDLLTYVYRVAAFMLRPTGPNGLPLEGPFRSEIYIDDLEVTADLSPDAELEFKERLEALGKEKEKKMAAFRDVLRNRKVELRKTSDIFKTIPEEPCWLSSDKRHQWQLDYRNRLYAHVKETLPKTEAELDRLIKLPNILEGQLITAKEKVELLENAVVSLQGFSDFADKMPELPYLIYIVPPVSNEKIIPQSFPVAGTIGTQLRLNACRGEYSPASFAIYADRDLKNVRIKISPLVSKKGIIPEENMDVHIVKCWWQAGKGVGSLKNPLLTPELLLKNPGIVIPDNESKRNIIPDRATIRDSRELQPTNIPAKTNQQFWITVHVPEDIEPGDYIGGIEITSDDAPAANLSIKTTVYPFSLAEPLLEYAIYYRGMLSSDETLTKAKPESEFKSEEQYLADLISMKKHGVRLPSVYNGVRALPDGSLDFRSLKKVLEVRKKAGMTDGPVLQMQHCLDFDKYIRTNDEAQRKKNLEQIKNRVEQWMKFVKETGYPEPLFYGIDEANGDVLDAQRDVYRAVTESGGKTGVALLGGYFERIGKYLTRPIVSGEMPCNERELAKIHEMGYKTWVYNTPQGGVEEPETYRRVYGLKTWKEGNDGVCIYAYQHSFGDGWDDWDDSSYRDHNMTYPAVDGPISTIQWEGFREGVNDVRYLTTLLEYIETAKKSEAKKNAAQKIEENLGNMDLYQNLDTVRKQIAEWILQIM